MGFDDLGFEVGSGGLVCLMKDGGSLCCLHFFGSGAGFREGLHYSLNDIGFFVDVGFGNVVVFHGVVKSYEVVKKVEDFGVLYRV